MGNESFYFQNGKVANDLWDLGMVLQNISQEEFRFHVNSQKNDFANWVQFSLNNPDFAFELRKTTDLDKTRKLLSDKFSSNMSLESPAKNSDSDALSGFDVQVNEDDLAKVSESTKLAAEEVVEVKNVKENISSESENVSETVSVVSKAKNKEESKNTQFNTHESVHVSSNSNHVSIHSHSLKPLILGAGFGVIVGMILMLILVRVGVF